MKIEWSITKTGIASSFSKVPKGAIVEAIDGITVIDRCESCGEWIKETDFHVTGEDATLCLTCYDKYIENEVL